VLVGGQNPTLDTWVLHEGRFTLKTPSRSPPNGDVKGLVWHGGLNSVVLLTGYSPTRTWLWDGRAWTEHVSATPPTPSVDPRPIAYDSRRNRLVLVTLRPLYGGSETWEWEPANGWSRVLTTGSLTPSGMAYDPLRARTVLTRFYSQGTATVSETWEYDGVAWQKMSPTRSGPMYARLCYAPALRAVVGLDQQIQPYQLLAWDGNDWSVVPTVGTLPDRTLHQGYAYDIARQRLRSLYAGVPSGIRDLIFETLRVDEHLPKLGQTVQLTLTVPQLPRSPWLLGLSMGDRPGIPLRAVPFVGNELLPLANDVLLRLSLEAGLGGVLDASGVGTFRLTVPRDPGLAGFRFRAAAVTLDLQRLEIGAISNPVELEAVR
jgi:hypothetical protein